MPTQNVREKLSGAGRLAAYLLGLKEKGLEAEKLRFFVHSDGKHLHAADSDYRCSGPSNTALTVSEMLAADRSGLVCYNCSGRHLFGCSAEQASSPKGSSKPYLQSIKNLIQALELLNDARTDTLEDLHALIEARHDLSGLLKPHMLPRSASEYPGLYRKAETQVSTAEALLAKELRSERVLTLLKKVALEEYTTQRRPQSAELELRALEPLKKEHERHQEALRKIYAETEAWVVTTVRDYWLPQKPPLSISVAIEALSYNHVICAPYVVYLWLESGSYLRFIEAVTTEKRPSEAELEALLVLHRLDGSSTLTLREAFEAARLL